MKCCTCFRSLPRTSKFSVWFHNNLPNPSQKNLALTPKSIAHHNKTLKPHHHNQNSTTPKPCLMQHIFVTMLRVTLCSNGVKVGASSLWVDLHGNNQAVHSTSRVSHIALLKLHFTLNFALHFASYILVLYFHSLRIAFGTFHAIPSAFLAAHAKSFFLFLSI